MHAKVSKFKYLFHPVSTKFPVNIEQHMLFVFGIATFWQLNYIANLAPKKEK
jgi:hypothetical protein